MNKIFRNAFSALSLAFILTCSVAAYAAQATEAGFPDVSVHHPYYEAILNLQKEDIIGGYPDGTFQPERVINRAEMMKVMTESLDKVDDDCVKTNPPPFSDVDLSKWYAKYICSAYEIGLVDGYDDNTFQPNRALNFAEAAKVITNAMIEPTEKGEKVWFKPYVEKLEGAESIPLSIYAFDKPINRGEVVEMYDRLLQKKEGRLTLSYAQVESGASVYATLNKEKSDYVNLRTSPSSTSSDNYLEDNYSHTHSLKEGQFIKIIGAPEGNWQKLTYYDGRTGYVHKDYLKRNTEKDDIIQRMEYKQKASFSDYKAVMMPQECPAKPHRFYWKLKKDNGEAMFLTYLATSNNSGRAINVVEDPYVQSFASLDLACGESGAPLNNRTQTGSSISGDKTGHYQALEQGRIYESKHGTFIVKGEIFKIHENETNDKERGTWSKYGFPISEPYKEDGKLKQKFEGGVIEVEAPDLFKTSVEDVVMRASTNSASDSVAIISDVNSDVYVTGSAVKGDYVGAYKTDKWYPVIYNDKEGYILTTLLHPDWIDFNILPDDINNFDKFSYKRDLIVLHFTGDNNTNDGLKNYFSGQSTSAHFSIDRDGNVMQLVQDFHTANHANPENYRSIGIEIMNFGPVKNIENTWYNWKESSVVKFIYDVLLKQVNVWSIWNMTENPNEQQASGGKSQYWQEYSGSQYLSLLKLLYYIEEKFDIPHKSFEYPIPGKNSECDIMGIYFSPQRVDWQSPLSEGGYANTKEWDDFATKRSDFRGIISHKNVSSKYDPGPHLDISKLELATQGQFNKCR